MPDQSQPKSVEEIKQKLRDLGIPVDGWGETEEHEVESPLLKRQKELMGSALGLLQHQLQQDQTLVAELHMKVARIQHGGGN